MCVHGVPFAPLSLMVQEHDDVGVTSAPELVIKPQAEPGREASKQDTPTERESDSRTQTVKRTQTGQAER